MAPVPAWARTVVQQRLFREGRRDSRPSPRVAAAFLIGLLLLLTGSCSVSHASGAPADGTAHATPATPASAAPTAPGFTMVASGDVLPHSPLVARARAYGSRSGRAYDFRPMFSAIKPIVSAACSTASNHSLDQGPQGVSGTLRVLDSAGLRHAGIARNRQEAQPTLLTVKGVRVAMLSYAYGFNGRKLPASQPWRANQINPARILADARAARRAGSQFTVVFLHWGQEYRTAPTPQQLRIAKQLLADPSIDLILGHHAHVVQPARRINGKWVAFGMGNLLSAQSSACCPANTQDGVIIAVHVACQDGRYVVGDLRYVPTWVQHPGYTVLPVIPSLAHGRLDPATRAALTISLRRTRAAMGPQVRPVSG